MSNTNNWVEFAIEMHNIDGADWKACRDMIPAREIDAILIINAFRAGWFTDSEIDTGSTAQFLAKINRIRVEKIVFGKFA